MPISANGRFVAFESSATNLVKHDDNLQTDVFVRDRKEGTTRRVSIRRTGEQLERVREDLAERSVRRLRGGRHPTITSDGRFVAFDSDVVNHVADDTNGYSDVFVPGPLR
jgi:Tol biopolymer transport system component